MSSNETYVRIEHKTGAYIAKTVETSPPRTLVEIVGVERHPLQGDLHHPYDPDVPLFHERRASAYREKVWVPTNAAKPYEGDIPPYAESLRRAWEELVQETGRLAEGEDAHEGGPGLKEWARKALHNLRQLEKDYWG
ncbi:sporulation phosphorelay system protein KapB [Paenibacillus hodogayensis]|uniref:Sporulation phosphorelay system protein KapB n=1 Tax=Paenibacillus hodogayensis TaxID=279208 RepID=A0ABV5W3W5_9BACL